MGTRTDKVVEKLKKKIQEWDDDFNQFQSREYPIRLQAQIQYRERMKALIAVRLLVEERLLNFNKRMKC
jgi:hypothetical protein